MSRRSSSSGSDARNNSNESALEDHFPAASTSAIVTGGGE
eukprot:CAMPEP_0180023778 /NCGR_PEP_ID=MMETSP0984-20121128/23720_1 /TAXON_ID=483367 /ORGANISM="non described non described, Strain CCMP 2436" /LENGTH=39 /DNA_ID= /DNA_START= /DNA_END= /DNA_ORIENTATION=